MLFIPFPLFPIFSLRQLTTNFERCLLCPEKVVLACFEDFACVPYCRNDKDMTTHEDPPKSNYFRTYFNQIY